MNRFDKKSIEEKLEVILEDNELTENRPWNKGLKEKFLISTPLLIFTILGIIFYSKEDSLGIIAIVSLPLICITLGVYLYSFMMR